MSLDRQNLALGERKGVPFYATNPSIPAKGELPVRERPKQFASGKDAMIVHPSGEVLGKASVAFMRGEEVDTQRFVKLYIEGVSGITGLSKAGTKVFEVVVAQLQDEPNKDQVLLSAYLAKKAGIEERTYQRGVRDLQDKEILFASHAEGVFFINIRFIFNGNRLHFVKSYYRSAGAAKQGQAELGFDDDSAV